MTAVAGIVHLDGGQASPQDLRTVLESLGASNTTARPTATGTAQFACAGLAQIPLPGACLDGNAFITASARLDNRDELLDLLGLRLSADFCDEQLIVAAYERWGQAFPERLNGDWCAAIWDSSKRSLFLARDHFGNTGLYFARVGSYAAFSSDLRSLASLPWLPRRLNDVRVASLLIGGGADEPTETVYRDISRLPPAHTVTITTGGEQLARYWKLEETPDRGPRDPHERTVVLRETLRAATASRLSGKASVGVMLSGGLDSGGVTAFAAEYLSRHDRRLTAFTAVPALPTWASSSDAGLVDEGVRAAEIVQSFDTIEHILVRASAVSPIAGIRRGLAIHREPSIAAANYGWLTELMGDAHTRGVDVLLTGQVGDFVMAGRPAVSSWRGDWSDRNYRSLLKRIAPQTLQRLRQVGWQPWRLTEDPWRNFSVIRREFAAETNLAERLQDRRRCSSTERQALSNVGAIWASLAAAFGLSVLDPLQDKRVMEVMFSAPRPAEARVSDRWIFRQSLAGVLPERVRLNRRKGLQSADIVERLQASWSEVEDALGIAEASPLAQRCIDFKYCRQLAASLRRSDAPGQSRRKAFTLVNGLSAALFLAESWQS